MGAELEAAGDLVTAGLVAHEIEGTNGDAKVHAHSGTCANCGAQVTSNYCGNCGQRGHLHNSVLHLVEELIHGLFHFETKGWRTLPLLVFRPGQLTKRFIDGQRTRFVSPLALFLFMMFLMFFVFSLTVGSVNTGGGTGTQAAGPALDKKIEQRKEQLAEAEAEMKAALPNTKDAEKAVAAFDKAKKKLEATEAARKAVVDGEAADEHLDWKKELQESGANKTYSDIPWINEAVKHAVDNPELALYKLKNAAYKYSFLLVPISMPFLWLMFFWKRGVTMFHHAVFSLYSIVGYFGFSAMAGLLFCFMPPVHMFMQLRGTYGLTRAETLWRTCALMFMSLIALIMYSLAVLALSMR
jgi:hypothetical protein